MQAPCIFINREGYRDIKHELNKLGFDLSLVQFEKNFSLLVTNYNNKKGKCGIINRDADTALNIYNRIICHNKNTFIHMCNVYMGKITKNDNNEIQNVSNINSFTKFNLKPGMVVQVRNTDYFFVTKINSKLVLINNSSVIDLDSYNENLNFNFVKGQFLDVLTVYTINTLSGIKDYLNGKYLTEIYSKRNVINITPNDLKKFKSDDSDIIKLKLNNGEVITIE